jgi:predicted metal-binding membrane protein
VIALGVLRQRLTHEIAWRPEWPAAVLAVAAWLALVLVNTGAPLLEQDAGHIAHHGQHAHTAPVPAESLVPGITASLSHWAVMAAAMMLPVTLPAVRHVAVNSIRARRWRAMAIFIAAYLGVWLGFGVFALGSLAALRSAGAELVFVTTLALTGATAWQLTRWKRRALLSCPRTVPLPPLGRRADAACARFGLLHAGRCVLSCAPYMVPMAVVGHNLVLTVGLTLVIALERFAPLRRRLVRPLAVTLAAATVCVALVM